MFGDNMETAVSPDLGDGEAKVVFVTHDESSIEVHDGKTFVWIESEKNLLKPKKSWRSIMVSQFLCQCHGAMEVALNNDILERLPHFPDLWATKLIHSGPSSLEIMRTGTGQIRTSSNKSKSPKCCLIFSILVALHCLHSKIPRTTEQWLRMLLWKTGCNSSDGGAKILHMRKGWFEHNGKKVEQDMQFEDYGRHNVEGRVQKGIRRFFFERGLWSFGGLSLDAARKLLAAQPDFASQKMWLKETV